MQKLNKRIILFFNIFIGSVIALAMGNCYSHCLFLQLKLRLLTQQILLELLLHDFFAIPLSSSSLSFVVFIDFLSTPQGSHCKFPHIRMLPLTIVSVIFLHFLVHIPPSFHRDIQQCFVFL